MLSRIAPRAPRALKSIRYNSSSASSRTARIAEMAGAVEKPGTSAPLVSGFVAPLHC